MSRPTPTRITRIAAAIAFSLLAAGGSSCGTSPAPAAGPATPSSADSPGAIKGRLVTPSLTHPVLRVHAIRVGPGSPRSYELETAKGQVSYVLGPVTPGTYTLVAYQVGGQYAAGDQARVGGYTAAVVCGLGATCTDHTPVPVVVRPGETAAGIDIADFAAPPGTFPPEPSPRG